MSFSHGDVFMMLAGFSSKPYDQIIRSSIKVVKIVERTRILAYFFAFTKCCKAEISAKTPFSDFLKNLVRF